VCLADYCPMIGCKPEIEEQNRNAYYEDSGLYAKFKKRFSTLDKCSETAAEALAASCREDISRM
jgi:hypothetical protein